MYRLMIFPVILAALLVLAFACGDDDDAATPTSTAGTAGTQTAKPQIGSVDVLGLWGGDPELPSFNALAAPWQTDTGGTVNFTGTRDITSILTTRVEGGDPPDVALPAEIGLFQQFAREGKLKPLSDCPGLEEKVKAEYPQGFLDLGTVDGKLYGFFMKADTKGTIWYNPKFFTENGYEPLTASSTFQDLISLSDQIKADGTVPPWSMGQEAGAGSGFPGTDWIQQILLNADGGPNAYDGIVDGSVAFTDARMKAAWEDFGKIALSDGYEKQGSADVINATAFQDSVFPPFESPPSAAMVYMGGFADGFIKEQFPSAVPGDDYNFFPFPGGGVTGSANVAYMFNASDTTCSFMTYLASASAQDIWVKRGGFTSVNKNVSLDSYPDAIAKALASQLTQAEVFRFDLDDAIGGALQQAMFTGVTSYLASPGTLDSILAQIEASRGQ